MIIDNSRFFTATYVVIITLLDRVLVMVYILVNYNTKSKRRKKKLIHVIRWMKFINFKYGSS